VVAGYVANHFIVAAIAVADRNLKP